MKTLSLIAVALVLLLGVAVSHAAATDTHVLTRISNETGVAVDTLQTQKSTMGLGYGDLENANLLAKASGQSFDTIAGKFKAGEGWGEIAHDYGLNLGKLVSAAHRSSQATLHAHKVHGQSTVRGKSSTVHGKSSTVRGKSTTHFGNSQSVSGNGGRGGAGPSPCRARVPACMARAPPCMARAPPCMARAPPCMAGAPPCMARAPLISEIAN